jgi:hypothetical protein
MIVYLVSSPDVENTFCESIPAIPSPAAQDDQAASLLWQRSAALVGIPELS